MLALTESGAEYLRRVRRIVEDMRTEFVLPD
jgi:DNA-binding PadR family transcriptional regulator